MRRLIAVAAVAVRHPAERAAIGHAHAHLLAGAGHGRRVKWCRLHDAPDLLDQRFLRRAWQIARHVANTLGQNEHRLTRLFDLMRPSMPSTKENGDPKAAVLALHIVFPVRRGRGCAAPDPGWSAPAGSLRRYDVLGALALAVASFAQSPRC